MVAELTVLHFWDLWKSAQILFVVPGEKEAEDQRLALDTWAFRLQLRYEIIVILHDAEPEMERKMRKRLEQQNFHRSGPALFVICTGGIGEAGWTIYVNGVIDSGLAMKVNELSFLEPAPSSQASRKYQLLPGNK